MSHCADVRLTALFEFGDRSVETGKFLMQSPVSSVDMCAKKRSLWKDTSVKKEQGNQKIFSRKHSCHFTAKLQGV